MTTLHCRPLPHSEAGSLHWTIIHTPLILPNVLGERMSYSPKSMVISSMNSATLCSFFFLQILAYTIFFHYRKFSHLSFSLPTCFALPLFPHTSHHDFSIGFSNKLNLFTSGFSEFIFYYLFILIARLLVCNLHWIINSKIMEVFLFISVSPTPNTMSRTSEFNKWLPNGWIKEFITILPMVDIEVISNLEFMKPSYFCFCTLQSYLPVATF